MAGPDAARKGCMPRRANDGHGTVDSSPSETESAGRTPLNKAGRWRYLLMPEALNSNGTRTLNGSSESASSRPPSPRNLTQRFCSSTGVRLVRDHVLGHCQFAVVESSGIGRVANVALRERPKARQRRPQRASASTGNGPLLARASTLRDAAVPDSKVTRCGWIAAEVQLQGRRAV